MKQKKKVKISVGSLVEFTSEQDIKRSFFSPERAVEGIKGHVEIQQSIKNISRNIKAVFFKLGKRNVHHKRKKDSCLATAMTKIMLLN